MNIIPPTAGRVVWFFPAANERARLAVTNPDEPLAAIVAKVWSDRMVNLAVCDPNGHWISMTSVPLVQPDTKRPELGSQNFCEWMPYQVGQAAKHNKEAS
jgi:hypothetical protein